MCVEGRTVGPSIRGGLAPSVYLITCGVRAVTPRAHPHPTPRAMAGGDSQRRTSHASQSSPIRSREIIKAINDLTTRVCGAMAESQARIDTTIESVVASTAECQKAVAEMAEARKMAAAQLHANWEKLNAAIANNYAAAAQRHAESEKLDAAWARNWEKLNAAWAQSHADSEKLNAAIANHAKKLADKHAKEASEDRAPSTEKASEEREIANKAAEVSAPSS